MGQTPTYQFPFPEPADPADVPTDIHELADRVEQILINPFDSRLDALEAGAGVGILADTVLAANAASIDLQNIPQTHAHLMAVAQARSAAASVSDTLAVRVNNDAGALYWWQQLNANAATVSAAGNMNQTALVLGAIAAASSAQATNSGVVVLFVPNYRDTTFRKAMVALGGALWDQTAATGLFVSARFGFYGAAPAAINRLTFLAQGGNLVTGSRLTLYGLKGTT